MTTISQTPPGRQVVMHVLRQGRMIEVPLVLSAKPRAAEDQISSQQFFDDRQRRADEYWTGKFAPLMDRGVS